MRVLLWLSFLLSIFSQTHVLPPALVVQLRDVAGAPVAGVAVTVHDLSGSATLARGATDRSGRASFDALPAEDVRVAVAGALPTGVPLSQPGDDVRGVAVVLGAPPVYLDLRVETDGVVRPDPATMIAPDVGVPAIAPPEPSSTPTAGEPAPPIHPVLVDSADRATTEQVEAPTDASLFWMGLTLVICLCAAAIILAALHVAGRHQ
jgi:hypothetical protein